MKNPFSKLKIELPFTRDILLSFHYFVNEGRWQHHLLASFTKKKNKNSSKQILMMGNKQLLIVPVTFASGVLRCHTGNNLSGESNTEITTKNNPP
ncbi:hypothetical protein CEXT_684221 [Caerostris extrusa]|uniref:Uncharacterized protein n=1 Tax=Caerostris extrusa TaxID=172846 RepID=A0AAV4T6J2_CAEEX|nr:hypothetical protein CEXT_684221 [Caerostris extrusa]